MKSPAEPGVLQGRVSGTGAGGPGVWFPHPLNLPTRVHGAGCEVPSGKHATAFPLLEPCPP